MAPIQRTWLVAGIAGGLTRLAGVRRQVQRLERVIEGMGLSLLSDQELNALTTACYGRSPTGSRTTLFEWEAEWFARDLPPAPARLLVGGAGGGRELHWLREAGYAVTAFDPVPAPDSGVLCASYEDLLPGAAAGHRLAGPSPTAAPRAILAGAPYDAVLLGWGSITHVPGAARREAVLRALRGLCEGPVLMSYWRGGSATEHADARATRLGLRLGQRMARRIGGDAGERDPHSDHIFAHLGYAHGFTEDEVRSLASSAGYLATCYGGAYAHATLHPQGSTA